MTETPWRERKSAQRHRNSERIDRKCTADRNAWPGRAAGVPTAVPIVSPSHSLCRSHPITSPVFVPIPISVPIPIPDPILLPLSIPFPVLIPIPIPIPAMSPCSSCPHANSLPYRHPDPQPHPVPIPVPIPIPVLILASIPTAVPSPTLTPQQQPPPPPPPPPLGWGFLFFGGGGGGGGKRQWGAWGHCRFLPLFPQITCKLSLLSPQCECMGTARSTALLLWAQLLSLVGSQPPLLTMDPPWTPQFVGQSVKLTCGEPSVSSSSTWYVDGQWWKKTPSNHLHVELSGKRKYSFQCRTRGSELSPAVDLTASNDWLVLQVPIQAVLEGDSLSLRCSAWKNTKLSQVKFFHDGKLLQDRRGDELLLSPAEQQHSGSYHCSAYVHFFSTGLKASAQTDLVVQELFSVPELSLQGPQEPPEGSALTLLCSTRGNALRPHVSLQHLFYQDGRLVGGPQSAPQHRVPALLPSHSGSYSCQVQTETGSVRKRSAPITVTVRRIPVAGVSLHSDPPDAQVLLGDRALLSCAVAEGSGPLSFSWHRQNRTGALGSGPLYELRAAQLGDDDRYHCTASNGISTASSPQLRLAVTHSPRPTPEPPSVPRAPHPSPLASIHPRLRIPAPVPNISLLPSPPHPRSLSHTPPLHPHPISRCPPSLLSPSICPQLPIHAHIAPSSQIPPGSAIPSHPTPSHPTPSPPSVRPHALSVPVSNASIAVLGTEVGAELERTAGEELNLSCRVGEGTGPVGFVWLRDGQELSRGPTWHLGVLGPQHAGTYQCVAANSLGTRRVFKARSPEVLLVVTRQGWGRRRAQVLAAGLPASLLVLLAVAAALGRHFWRRRRGGESHKRGAAGVRRTWGQRRSPGDAHRLLSPSFAAASKRQHRDPAAPPGLSSPPILSTEPSEPDYINVPPRTPSAEDVLYCTVTITERGGGASPRGPSAPQEAAVTYTDLRGMQHPSDSYENLPHQ
ncbi:LOW QUALITY PROTEIN: Fc receptor-like protein 3 [Centrocercus urophasianus]|uniref:LOW QUALITY PROTEIN: Fc receptor-like protein 3 n=1 Tax=Centrocercus urophasianus TaxID=9002 RepID=UPI001C64D90E|nr:LOW QUALITY PROTEIN: Fc receptor-like protein 3 [Centrocercus urophasianus]